MKALTIRQPWAQLIACGAKNIENRDWPTRYRGRIAIHSSAALHGSDVRAACDTMRRFIPRFSSRIFTAEAKTYPLGAIIAIAYLSDCVQSCDSPWFFGPYGFVLENVRKLANPIPCKGALGLWNIGSLAGHPEIQKVWGTSLPIVGEQPTLSFKEPAELRPAPLFNEG